MSTSESEKQSADAIIARMREVSHCKNDAELGRRFDIARSSISKWRARNTVPLDQIHRIAALTNTTVSYIQTGDNRGVVFSSISPVDWTALEKILVVLRDREQLPGYDKAQSDEVLHNLAKRIAWLYNNIDELSQTISASHDVDRASARRIALDALSKLAEMPD